MRLQDRGTALNLLRRRNRTALQAACGAGYVELTQRLSAMGTDIDEVGGYYGTVLLRTRVRVVSLSW